MYTLLPLHLPFFFTDARLWLNAFIFVFESGLLVFDARIESVDVVVAPATTESGAVIVHSVRWRRDLFADDFARGGAQRDDNVAGNPTTDAAANAAAATDSYERRRRACETEEVGVLEREKKMFVFYVSCFKLKIGETPM